MKDRSKAKDEKGGQNPHVKVAKYLKATAFGVRNRGETGQAKAAIYWESLFDQVIETGGLPKNFPRIPQELKAA